MTDKRDAIIKRRQRFEKLACKLRCPRCGRATMERNLYHNAFSRRCDLYICPACGTEEAMEDFAGCQMPLENWSLFSTEGRLDPDWFDLQVKLDIKVTPEDIDDIMSAALDGGITYWCCKAEVIEDEYYGEYASEQIASGGSLRLYDMESEDSFVLTLDDLMNGIKLAFKNGYAKSWLDGDRIDTCQIDCEAADVIIQYAIFEDVIYG